MLEKTKKKLERKGRPTWVGYYSRKTPTRTEKLRKAERKHKGRGVDNDSSVSYFTQIQLRYLSVAAAQH